MPPGRSTDGKFHVRPEPADEGLGLTCRGFTAAEPVSSTSAEGMEVRGLRMLRTSRFCLVGAGRDSRSGRPAARRDGPSSAVDCTGAASTGGAGRVAGASRSGAFAATGGSARSEGAVTATTGGGGGTTAMAGGGGTEGVSSGRIVCTISARGGGLRHGRTSAAVPMPATRAQAASTAGICRRSVERRDPRGASGPMRSSGPGARSEAEPAPRFGRSHTGRWERVRSAICAIGIETTSARGRSNPSVLCVVQGTMSLADARVGPVRRRAGGVHAGRSRARGPRGCCR